MLSLSPLHHGNSRRSRYAALSLTALIDLDFWRVTRSMCFHPDNFGLSVVELGRGMRQTDKQTDRQTITNSNGVIPTTYTVRHSFALPLYRLKTLVSQIIPRNIDCWYPTNRLFMFCVFCTYCMIFINKINKNRLQVWNCCSSWLHVCCITICCC